ncbi:MAG: MBL fold metallo-hydrolase [Erysipelotrichales bacterium]|nr:MBL fold metallo-hydrolase [Erysipelotrichales bacterium]
MKIKRLIVGEEDTNCYVISNDGEAIIIDPGDNSKKIAKYVAKEELKVLAIFLTHGHYDHTKAVDTLVNLYNCPCYLDSEDLVFTSYNSKIEGSITLKTKCLNYKEIIDVSNYHFEIVKTPGHTSGSVCISIDNYVFTGDTIFVDGIGRYDLYGSSKSELMESIEFIKSKYDGYTCYPGHEESFIIS